MTAVAEFVERVRQADVEPTNMPPHATLLVRRIDDPLPGAALDETDRWLAALRRELEHQVRLARPANRSHGDDSAVLFTDPVSLIAARVEAVGDLPGNRRWFHPLLAVGAPATPAAVLAEAPEWAPAAIVELVDHHGEAALARLVTTAEAEHLTSLIERAFSVTVPRALGTPPLPAGDASPTPSPTSSHTWSAEWASRAPPRPHPDAVTALIAAATLLSRHPGSLHITPRLEPTHDPSAADPVPAAPGETPERVGGRRERTVGPIGSPVPTPLGDDVHDRSVGDTSRSPTDSDGVPTGGGETTTPAVAAPDPRPPAVVPAARRDANAPADTSTDAGTAVVETRFAGFVYAVNLIRALGLFDRVPTDPGGSLLAGVARLAVRDADGDDGLVDPLWSALLTLAGTDEPIELVEARVDAAVVDHDDTRAAWVDPTLLGRRAHVGDLIRSALDRLRWPDDEPGVASQLLRVGGVVSIGRTHVDVTVPLDRIDLRIRNAGLDVDPGWVPELARVITLEFAG